MRNPVILMVACAVVLAGAYFVSRMLVAEVPATVTTTATGTGAPNVVTVVSAPPDSVQPMMAAPSRGGLNRQEAEAAMLAPRQGLMQPVNAPMPHLVDPGPPAVAEVAASPFQGESKELDYAEALLAEPNPGLERLQSAHQVLARCVEQEPGNERCRASLTTAQNLLGGKAATERVPERPTLRVDPPNVRLK